MRPTLALAVVAGLAAAPAVADDAAALEGCLGAADRAEDCIDAVAGPCREVEGDTTLAIATCAMREADAWDALLNRSWAPLRDGAKADGSWDALLAAQRAWLAFRDAECAHAYAQYGGGSMRTIAAANCRMTLTAARAIEFRQRATDAR